MGAFFKWIGTTFGVLVMVGVVFGFLMEAGFVPSDRVLAGKDVPQDQYQTLISEGIIGKDEIVEYFYSEGLMSVREGGSILTNKRVIAYEEALDDQIEVYEIMNDDIISVEQVQAGDALNFSVYTVSAAGEDNWFDLWLPHEHGDGERFATAVEAKIR